MTFFLSLKNDVNRPVFRIRIRRFHMFLALPDPDPHYLYGSTGPDRIWIRIRILPSSKIVRKNLISIVLWIFTTFYLSTLVPVFRIRLFFDLYDSYPTSLVRGSEPTCLVDPDLHPDPDTHNFGHLNPHQGNADQQHCCKPTELLRNNGSGYRKILMNLPQNC